MRRWFALSSLLAALTSFPLLADDPLPPHHAFGSDTSRTGAFTGAGTALGLTCNAPAAPMECSGFLASDVDGTALDVTLKIPAGTAPLPLVVNLHGYGGSKQSDSSWDDRLLQRGYAVLRYSARGFGKSWGQVNLADLNVELRDLRSLITQVLAGRCRRRGRAGRVLRRRPVLAGGAAAAVRDAGGQPGPHPHHRADRSLDRPARCAAAERRCDQLHRRARLLQAELSGRALPGRAASRSGSAVPELPRLPLHLERVHPRG